MQSGESTVRSRHTGGAAIGLPLRIKHTMLLKLLLIIGLIPFSSLMANLLPIGHGVSLDGVRNLFLFAVISLIAWAYFLLSRRPVVGLLESWPFLLFVLWAVLSSLWSLSISYTVRELVKLIYPIVLYLFARSALRNQPNTTELFQSLISILGLFCIITFGSLLVEVALGIRSYSLGADRLLDPLFGIHPAMAALYLFGELSGKLHVPHWRLNKVAIGCALLYLVLSLTRAYLFGAVAGLGAVVLLRSRRLLWWLVAIGVTLGAAILILTVDNPIKTRMFWQPEEVTLQTILDSPQILFSPEYVRFSGRTTFWRFLLAELHKPHGPWLGGGLGSARYALENGQIWGEIAVAHGSYAKYLAELGYIGFALFLFCLLLGATWFGSKALRVAWPWVKVGYSVLCGGMVFLLVADIGYEVFDNGFDYLALLAVVYAITRAQEKQLRAMLPAAASQRQLPALASSIG
jgi:O-antigen ligase